MLKDVSLTFQIQLFPIQKEKKSTRFQCVYTGRCKAAYGFLTYSDCSFRFGRLYVGQLCVSFIWLMLLKKQIHVIISKERLEHGKLCIFSSAVTTK